MHTAQTGKRPIRVRFKTNGYAIEHKFALDQMAEPTVGCLRKLLGIPPEMSVVWLGGEAEPDEYPDETVLNENELVEFPY